MPSLGVIPANIQINFARLTSTMVWIRVKRDPLKYQLHGSSLHFLLITFLTFRTANIKQSSSLQYSDSYGKTPVNMVCLVRQIVLYNKWFVLSVLIIVSCSQTQFSHSFVFPAKFLNISRFCVHAKLLHSRR